MAKAKTRRVVFQPTTYRGVQQGINKIANAIRPTLGPQPRTVAIDLIGQDKMPELLDNGGVIAKRIIQLFMTGGASPMDTFDYKPQVGSKNTLSRGDEYHNFTSLKLRYTGKKILFGEVVNTNGLWWRKTIWVIATLCGCKSSSVNGFYHFFAQ